MPLITRGPPQEGRPRRPAMRSQSAPRPRPDWDSTEHDLSAMRLTPDQLVRGAEAGRPQDAPLGMH
jgi:hypothetical protein